MLVVMKCAHSLCFCLLTKILSVWSTSSHLHLLPSTSPPMPPPRRSSRGGAEEWSTPTGEACKRCAAWTDPEPTPADSPPHQGLVPSLGCTSSVRQLQTPFDRGPHPWSFPCLQQLLDPRYLSIHLSAVLKLEKCFTSQHFLDWC